jgi:hypothetical protein
MVAGNTTRRQAMYLVKDKQKAADVIAEAVALGASISEPGAVVGLDDYGCYYAVEDDNAFVFLELGTGFFWPAVDVYDLIDDVNNVIDREGKQ